MFSFWRQSSWWWLLAALSCARAALQVQGGNLLSVPSVAVKPAAHHAIQPGITRRPATDSSAASANPVVQSGAGSGRRLDDGSVETNEMLRTGSRPINELFPFAVLYGPTCGGTIISPTWIITAAHCSLFTSGRYVLAGTNNTRNQSGGVRVRVKRKVLHPRFSVGPYWLNADDFGIKQIAARYDFLLAELDSPLKLDGKLLAAAALDYGPTIPPGLDVAYAGFGAEHHGETMRDEMHAMELQTVTDEVCARRLPEYDAQDMLCAKGIPPRFDSACNGDSGSGLVHEGQLLGVTSWVEDDAFSCHPGALVVFSKIARVRDWIRKTTGV